MPEKSGPMHGQGLGEQLIALPPISSTKLNPFRVQGVPKILLCPVNHGYPYSLKGRYMLDRDGQGPGSCHNLIRFSGCWALHGLRWPLWIVSRQEPHVGRTTSQCQLRRVRPGLCTKFVAFRRFSRIPLGWQERDPFGLGISLLTPILPHH